jgi:hypothetical protein
MIKNILIYTLLLTFSASLTGQKMSWRKHAKLADEFYKKAQYAEAADHYQKAWVEKPKKDELIFKAGESYYIIKDYARAAAAYEKVKDETKQYPMVGLKYARSLKQSGQYDQAAKELANFIDGYKGSDKATLAQTVENEIKGCELGQEMQASGPDPDVEVVHLSDNINSPETEFAPIPFTDDILYFSSTIDQRAQIYRSQKIDNEWTKASLPASFPDIPDDHFCNGTLTPDSKRFYFTICKSVESWGGLTTRCEIFVTKRIGTSWTTPERLKDYVNLDDATTTHPFVVHEGDTEILYFASNRNGGIGGMDIWYMTRDKNSNGIDFTFPVNAGDIINTPDDEITPYYDQQTSKLYFGSNGHVSIGGLDIFQSTGSKDQWTEPENLGLPYNSSADDYFYIETPSRSSGFLVSNRAFGAQKKTTTHEDIFSFSKRSASDIILSALGEVLNEENNATLANVMVSLYKIATTGERELIDNKIFPDGNYDFRLEADNFYLIEAEADGFFPGSYTFSTATNVLERQEFGQSIYLQPMKEEDIATPDDPTTDDDYFDDNYSDDENYSNNYNDTDDKDEDYEGAEYTSRGQSKWDNLEFITNAPRLNGTYYKVQLMATSKYKKEDPKFAEVKTMGRVDTEFLVDRQLHRVLIAEFYSLDDAKSAMDQAKELGFKGAYVVKYSDGERIGRVWK